VVALVERQHGVQLAGVDDLQGAVGTAVQDGACRACAGSDAVDQYHGPVPDADARIVARHTVNGHSPSAQQDFDLTPGAKTGGRQIAIDPDRAGHAERYADSSAGASIDACPPEVTSVGRVPRSIVSRVTTQRAMSDRDGSSNITSVSALSMIERRPRAPVSRARA
jgi:hypothetical protein